MQLTSNSRRRTSPPIPLHQLSDHSFLLRPNQQSPDPPGGVNPETIAHRSRVLARCTSRALGTDLSAIGIPFSPSFLFPPRATPRFSFFLRSRGRRPEKTLPDDLGNTASATIYPRAHDNDRNRLPPAKNNARTESPEPRPARFFYFAGAWCTRSRWVFRSQCWDSGVFTEFSFVRRIGFGRAWEYATPLSLNCVFCVNIQTIYGG